MTSGALLFVFAVAGLALPSCRLDAGDWDVVNAGIQQRFPDVVPLSTEQLALWLAQTDSVAPVLLDARAAEEFAVSHLSGAHLAPTPLAATRIAGTAIDTPIVVYCSVGYRSAALARQLQTQGYTQVRNLQGSLFQWANEGRAIVDDEGPVPWVHPYGRPWSGLLHKQLRWRPGQTSTESPE